MKYERLTEKNSRGEWIVRRVEGYSDCASVFSKDGNFLIGNVCDRLAELENKIENGTLVELPCKVGDKVYYIWLNESISESKIDVIRIRRNTITFDTASGMTYLLEHLGQSVFLTKEQAEAKLKELRGEE